MIVDQDDLVPRSFLLFDQVKHSGYLLIMIAISDNNDSEFRI